MKANSPTHEEIAQCAQKIWQERGRPDGRDTEIWFEAERQLAAGSPDSNANSSAPEASRTVSESKGAAGLAERTINESTGEHGQPPGAPGDGAAKATLQKKEARAPKSPTHTAPKTKPAETGKPLWNTPHSS